MLKSKSSIFLLGLEMLALAAYLWHETVSVYWDWRQSRLSLLILLLIIFLICVSLGLYKILQHMSKVLSKRTGIAVARIVRAFILSLSPLLFLFLIFVQHFVFLKDMRPFLLPVSLGGSAYLAVIFLSRLKKTYPQAIATPPETIQRWNPNRLEPKRLAWFVFVISVSVYILYSSGLIVPSQPLTGDEPHYLLTTHSIIKDGDINVYNNYRDKDYLDFYPGELSIHAFAGKKGDGHLYSKHFIALSALMVPTYALGEKLVAKNSNWSGNPETKRRILVFFARFPVCLITALFSLIFFLLVVDITQRKDVAVLAWAVFSFTSPVLFFSHLLYPAVSVALLTILAFRLFVLNKETRSLSAVLSGAAIGLLPWFGVKFIVLAAVLFGASALTLLSSRKAQYFWKKALLFLLPIAVSAGLYLLYFWTLYGNFSPVSAYTGVTPGAELPAYAKKLLLFSFFETLSRSLGFFIDQKYGLLIYAPIYILGFAGLYFYARKKRREASLLMVMLAVPWIFSANYYWGGYCPPGRPVFPVFWIWGLFLALALAAKQNPGRKILATTGIVLSFAMVWAALRNPWILYHEQYASELGGEFLYSKLTRALSNSFVKFHDLLPSLKELEVFNWLTLVIWIIAICGIVVLYIQKNEIEKSRRLSLKMGGHLCFVFGVSLLLVAYVFFDIHRNNKAVFEEQNYTLYFQDDNHFGKEAEGFWTKGKRRASVILESPHPLAAIRIKLASSVGGFTSVQVGPSKKKINRAKSTGLSNDITFSPVKGFPLRQGYCYFITIEDSSGFVPFQLDRNIKDNRNLGVFVQLKAVN